MKETKHEMLVALLNKNFGYKLKTQKENFGSELKINANDVNQAVMLFCDALNINSGSTGTRDLYTFLNKYLNDKEFQEKVEELK